MNRSFLFSIFSFLFFIFSPLVWAQNDFSSEDTLFFKQSETAAWTWFGKIGIDSTQIESLGIGTESGRVILSLTFPDSDTWLRLRGGYLKANNRSLEEDILEKIAFWCEIRLDQTELQVRSDEYYLQAYYDSALNYALHLQETKLRTSSRALFVLPPHRKSEGKKLDTKTTLKEAQNRILNTIRKYYLNQSTLFYLGTPNLSISTLGESKATVRISNIKGAVVPELLKIVGHYELITIGLNLKFDGTLIEYECVVDGKYGEGIISEPRNHEYRDMGEKYNGYIVAYNRKLMEYLKTELSKQ